MKLTHQQATEIEKMYSNSHKYDAYDAIEDILFTLGIHYERGHYPRLNIKISEECVDNASNNETVTN